MSVGSIGLFLYEYQLETRLGVPGAVALREAQTMAVTTVLLFQVFYLLNCRSLHDSMFRIGIFSNPDIYIGIGALAVLQLAFVYAPVMNSLFGTAPLNADAVLKTLLIGMTVLPAISAERWWHQKRDARRKGGELAGAQL